MFVDIIDGVTGWFHFVTSLLAIVTGTIVILNTKGTRFHKRVGYVYVFSMVSLNTSAFFIVNFGGLSIFHFFAIVSLLTVLGGMIAAWRRKKNWFTAHFYFMSWSVVGLYAALWSEIGTRFVKNLQDFWWMVAIATLITVGLGARIINKQAKKLKLK